MRSRALAGDLVRQRLAALAALALALFALPLLLPLPAEVAGWPLAGLWIFAAWGALIGLAAWLVERRSG